MSPIHLRAMIIEVGCKALSRAVPPVIDSVIRIGPNDGFLPGKEDANDGRLLSVVVSATVSNKN